MGWRAGAVTWVCPHTEMEVGNTPTPTHPHTHIHMYMNTQARTFAFTLTETHRWRHTNARMKDRHTGRQGNMGWEGEQAHRHTERRTEGRTSAGTHTHTHQQQDAKKGVGR